MRLSEFERAVDQVFGALGAVIVADQSIAELGGVTARQALADGTPARAVWEALCRANDVPAAAAVGQGLLPPPQ